MEYEKGFKDAVELFEDAINRTIKSGDNNLDKVISTLYVIGLKWEEIYENAVIEGLEGDCDGNCNDCTIGMMIDRLNELFKGGI